MKEEIICIVCPRGCRIEAEQREEELILSGFGCEHGREYAGEEFLHPQRFYTGTAAIEGADRKRLPVRTDKKIPKERLQDCAGIAAELRLSAPVAMGEPLTEGLFGTDARLVASMTLDAKDGRPQ